MTWLFASSDAIANITPAVTQVFAIATMLLLSDLISQKIIQRKPAIDARQATRFFMIGALYTGPLVVTWYSWVESVVGREIHGAVLVKALLGQVVFSPLLLLGTIVLFDVFQRRSWTDVRQSIRNKYLPLQTAVYAFWIPVELVNFQFVAARWRALFNGVVCLFFKTYMTWRMSRVCPVTDATSTAKEPTLPA
ncbi:unnamed protein product [Ixodes persulcatus]